MKGGERELDLLVSDARWALERQLEPRDLVPMLSSVLDRAEPGSPADLFARKHLAQLLVEHEPWQAARLAQDVLAHEPDHQAYAVLALSHTLLGHYRCAKKAYRQALALAPGCPAYAHNLGHLLDVALNRPADALPYLECAHRELPDESEVASSLAHALARADRRDEARTLLIQALQGDADRAEHLLQVWLRSNPAKPAEQAEVGSARFA